MPPAATTVAVTPSELPADAPNAALAVQKTSSAIADALEFDTRLRLLSMHSDISARRNRNEAATLLASVNHSQSSG